MAKKGKTPVGAPAPAPVTPATANPPLAGLAHGTPHAANPVCQYCGKHVSRHTSIANLAGGKCVTLAANYTPAALQAHYASVTGNVPAGYIPLATLDKAVKAHKATIPGLTIAKMVKAIGGDRALLPPAHPICKPVYNGRQRYVNGWLNTPAGLQAIASSNYSKAPKA